MTLDFFINIYRAKLSTCQQKNVLGVKESKAYWHDGCNRNERKIVNVCDNQIKKRISRKEKKKWDEHINNSSNERRIDIWEFEILKVDCTHVERIACKDVKLSTGFITKFADMLI